MARTMRNAPGGLAYHALNRANARSTIFRKPADYLAFEQLLEEAVARSSMRLCSYWGEKGGKRGQVDY